MYTGGELLLVDYNWSLKSWDGDLLATQHYMVRSQGGAARERRYTLCQSIIMPGGTPVYKQDEGVNYLYLSEYGFGSVGDVAGDNYCYLVQKSNLVWCGLHKDNQLGTFDSLGVYPGTFVFINYSSVVPKTNSTHFASKI